MAEADRDLILCGQASKMLAEATTVQEAKALKDLALTAADWARRKGMGEEAVRHAQQYALMAERRMGQMLAAGQKAGTVQKRGRPKKKTTHGEDLSPVQISELGVTFKESVRAQAVAALPEEKFQDVLTGKKMRTQAQREYRREQTPHKRAPLPTDKYRVLYADPPWKYGDTRDGRSEGAGAGPGTQGQGLRDYHTPKICSSGFRKLRITRITVNMTYQSMKVLPVNKPFRSTSGCRNESK